MVAAMAIKTDLAGKISLGIIGASVERSGSQEAVMFADSIDREATSFWFRADADQQD